VITIGQAVVSGFAAGVLFAAFTLVVGFGLGRRFTLAEMADPAHNLALDRTEVAAWLAASEPTTLRRQLADEDVPEFMRWDAERGDRG
jgi:hypothetical protein